jgi:hypothetical protein
MPFKKEFTKQHFKKALSSDWQTTGQIAKKVGCSRHWAEQELEKIYKTVLVGSLSQYNVYNTIEVVECREKRSTGRFGFTREWKLKEDTK